jgi:Ca2+/Na+ antiporter
MVQTRQQALAKIQAMIESRSWPRVQMTLLVVITGAIGFLTSFILLHLGMTTLWLRYLLSMVAAYVAFLFLLWVWARTRNKDLSDGLDIPDFGKSGRDGGSKDCNYEGQGGDFGGGGASGSYHPEVPTGESPSGGSTIDFVPELELEELAIPVIVLVVVVLLVGSSFLVIVNAPALFAELVLDGILSASLYRRLRGIDQKHWLETAIRKTALPFTTITILLVAFGWTIQWLNPSASSIGEFLSHRNLRSTTTHNELR